MSDSPENKQTAKLRTASLRIAIAFIIALAFSFAVYLLIDANRGKPAWTTLSFLFVLPGALSAFIAYVGDPFARRDIAFYLMAPIILLGVALAASAILFREGLICIMLLAPLWLCSGLMGGLITYKMRRRAPKDENRFVSVGLLLLPLLIMQFETFFPQPQARAAVSRDIVIAATPEEIWPHLESIANITPAEGQWNLSQDVIGIPPPREAVIVQQAGQEIRKAQWGENVSFDEIITERHKNRLLAWQFRFPNDSVQRYSDPHLAPDGDNMKIETGRYKLKPLSNGKTRLTLETTYRMQTSVNSYASLWGEFFLGDIQGNILTIIKKRSEEI